MDLDIKRQKRRENKKRKIAAFLAVAELNDVEKKNKKQKTASNTKEDVDVEDENDNLADNVNKSGELVTKYSSNTLQVVSDKPKLEGADYEALKKRLRERKKALSCNPIFRLKTVGEEALMHRKSRVPLFMSDVQVGLN